MKIAKLHTAITEAERFLVKAHHCIATDAEGRVAGVRAGWLQKDDPDIQGSAVATAAVKRSSMDLSKALADLRDVRRKP